MTYKVKSSAIMPIMSSNAMIEIEIDANAGEAGTVADLSLGKTYKNIKVVSIGVLNKTTTAYTGAISVQRLDFARVAVTAPAVANAAPLINITLVCEV